MTLDDAKKCGYVLRAGDEGFDPEKPTPPCDGLGLVQCTGEKAKMGLRYMKCQKCGAVWQVTFKPPPPEQVLDRSNATRPEGGRPPGRR